MTEWKVTMNVSSVPVSSLATSQQAPSTTAVDPKHRNVGVGAAAVVQSHPQQVGTAPAVKAALPPKVGQAIDITA